MQLEKSKCNTFDNDIERWLRLVIYTLSFTYNTFIPRGKYLHTCNSSDFDSFLTRLFLRFAWKWNFHRWAKLMNFNKGLCVLHLLISFLTHTVILLPRDKLNALTLFKKAWLYRRPPLAPFMFDLFVSSTNFFCILYLFYRLSSSIINIIEIHQASGIYEKMQNCINWTSIFPKISRI